MARLRRQDCPRRRAVAAAAATGGVVGASDDRFGDVGDGPDPRKRADIAIGAEVDIVLKADQGTDRLTRGVVREFLTNSKVHHQGIKVRLVDGAIGRVQRIVVVGGEEEQGGGGGGGGGGGDGGGSSVCVVIFLGKRAESVCVCEREKRAFFFFILAQLFLNVIYM